MVDSGRSGAGEQGPAAGGRLLPRGSGGWGGNRGRGSGGGRQGQTGASGRCPGAEVGDGSRGVLRIARPPAMVPRRMARPWVSQPRAARQSVSALSACWHGLPRLGAGSALAGDRRTRSRSADPLLVQKSGSTASFCSRGLFDKVGALRRPRPARRRWARRSGAKVLAEQGGKGPVVRRRSSGDSS